MTVNYVRWLRSYVGHQRLLQLAASAFILDDDGRLVGICTRGDLLKVRRRQLELERVQARPRSLAPWRSRHPRSRGRV